MTFRILTRHTKLWSECLTGTFYSLLLPYYPISFYVYFYIYFRRRIDKVHPTNEINHIFSYFKHQNQLKSIAFLNGMIWMSIDEDNHTLWCSNRFLICHLYLSKIWWIKWTQIMIMILLMFKKVVLMILMTFLKIKVLYLSVLHYWLLLQFIVLFELACL